ncbi:MAG: outer membrane beta-barrel protein [Bacteroidales bacterium]|nr:outer membrane beta-barrel protein [Bacteroidales bacterium]
MKRCNKKVGLLMTLFLCCSFFSVQAGTVKGQIIDKQTKEPLIGVTIQIVGTSVGAVTDLDGNYVINNLKDGTYDLEIRYVSYKTIQKKLNHISNEILQLNFEMETDEKLLEMVTIVAKKNLENEMTLLKERQAATVAIENIGAKEMSLKGVSNAADGVKKLTGISFADADRLIVRGLGDRYSSTSLNGLPIASPNPDNKLIPLDLFPSSCIKNITVKKVYEVGTFADYSGAHINIGTRENMDEDFFKISLNAGGRVNTVFQEFHQGDQRFGLWKANNLSTQITEMTSKQFSEYIKTTDPFGTTFTITQKKALPDFGGNISFGKNFKIGKNGLGVLASLSMSHESQTMENVYKATLTAQGSKLNEFSSNSYSSFLNMSALVGAGYNFRKEDAINYTLFYARNAVDNYKLRDGFDSEQVHLIGSNSVMHIYSLLNNQLSGKHAFGKRWNLLWSGSYGITASSEPDRRQVMYREENDQIYLFKLNQQETMRYFGTLNEREAVGDIRSQYRFGNDHLLQFGATYKNKKRDFQSTRFYYNIRNLNTVIESIDEIYDPSNYLNQENIENGTIGVLKDAQPKSSYDAGSDIMAAFTEVILYPWKSMIINVGVRFEQSNQWVHYWNDAAIEKLSQLNTTDWFPALHFKYNINKTNDLKLSLSKTVTRPEFIEMAPFLYKESFGSDEIRGNENLQNGYNYNIDLRYDLFPASNNGNMLSIAGYYKFLKNPIERVQESSGGSAVHSFRNAENGMAAGIELEFRQQFLKYFKFGLNAAFIFTNVVLPEDGGVYTDSKRALQGASPYLINADLSYKLNIKDKQQLDFVLLYNLQGPRIHSVGIYGVGNVIQKPLHTLDFVGHWKMNDSWSMKLKIKDLLNTTIQYTQEVKSTGNVVEVERYQPGTNFEIGVTFEI